MNLNIKATKTTLTPSIQSDIEAKFSVLEPFLRSEHTVRVEIEAEAGREANNEFRAEVAIQPGGHFAQSNGGDLYEAIDLLIPKIKQQLTRDKDKKVSLRRKLGNTFKRIWSRGR